LKAALRTSTKWVMCIFAFRQVTSWPLSDRKWRPQTAAYPPVAGMLVNGPDVRSRPSLVENDAAQSRIYFVGPRLPQKRPWQRLGQVTVLRQVLRRKINGSIISMPELPTVSQKQMIPVTSEIETLIPVH
jgi:hypothetical protein